MLGGLIHYHRTGADRLQLRLRCAAPALPAAAHRGRWAAKHSTEEDKWPLHSDRKVCHFWGQRQTREEVPMRVAVFGAGGVGGYFGARLAAAGVDVVFIARGAHLEAIRTSGLRLERGLGDVLVHPAHASDSPTTVERVDVVLLGVKTWQVPEAADVIRPLLGPETCVVSLQNGVETPAVLTDCLGAAHVVGGVCGAFSFIAGPGHIRHIGGTPWGVLTF